MLNFLSIVAISSTPRETIKVRPINSDDPQENGLLALVQADIEYEAQPNNIDHQDHNFYDAEMEVD